MAAFLDQYFKGGGKSSKQGARRSSKSGLPGKRRRTSSSDSVKAKESGSNPHAAGSPRSPNHRLESRAPVPRPGRLCDCGEETTVLGNLNTGRADKKLMSMMVCRRRKCDFTAIFDLAAADGRGPAPPPQPSHRGDQPVRIGPPVDAGALQRGTRPGTCTMTSPAPGGVPSIHGGVPSMLVDAMLQSVLGDGGSPAVTPSAADGVATAGPAAVPTPVGSDGDAIDRRVPQVNREVIGQLRRLLATYHHRNERPKIKHLKNLINHLKTLIVPLSSLSSLELRGLPDVNNKTAEKIGEILRTGSLTRNEEFYANPINRRRVLFESVWGFGPQAVDQILKNDDYKTLADLTTAPFLSEMQKIGLERHVDIQRTIPRAEVEQIGAAVIAAATRAYPRLEIMVCGSYRRGNDESGDVDMLATMEGGAETRLGDFNNLVKDLLLSGMFTDDVNAAARAKTDRGSLLSKFSGLCKLPDKPYHRRIDIICVPFEQKATQLIYFTGCTYLNRCLKRRAEAMGLYMSAEGIFEWANKETRRQRSGLTTQVRAVVEKGQLIPGLDTEQKIFALLKVPYIAPTDRKHFDIRQFNTVQPPQTTQSQQMTQHPAAPQPDQPRMRYVSETWN